MPKAIEVFKQAKEFGEFIEDEGKILRNECQRPLRGQVGEALQDGRRHHAQFVGGELGAIEPEGLKAERSGSRNIPKIRRNKGNRFLGKV